MSDLIVIGSENTRRSFGIENLSNEHIVLGMENIQISKKVTTHLRMTVKPDGTVRVIAPIFTSDRTIHDRINTKSKRIDRVRAKLAAQQELIPQLTVDQLFLFGDIYTRARGTHNEILDAQQKVISTTFDLDTIKTKQQRLRGYARSYLTRRARELSIQHGLNYKKLFIRAQTTKRGTCSSKRYIGLNRKLIQLPSRVIDYVICHELAHLVHLNHSGEFRAFLDTIYPQATEAKKRLRTYADGIIMN